MIYREIIKSSQRSRTTVNESLGLENIVKFKEYDVVRVMKNCDKGVKKGETGVVLMAFEEPEEAYEIEILDEKGNFKEQCTLIADDLEFVTV